MTTTYGSLMGALFLSLRTAATVDLSPDKLWNAGLFAILSAFVLSRLLLVLTNLQTFLAYPVLLLTVPSLTALGLLLTAMATLLYLRLRHLPLLRTLDAWAPCATLTWAFLALGHFAEGADPGLPTTLPWGMAIPPDTAPRLHPVPLYSALAALLITAGLLRVSVGLEDLDDLVTDFERGLAAVRGTSAGAVAAGTAQPEPAKSASPAETTPAAR